MENEQKVKSFTAENTNLSYFTFRKIIGWTGFLLPWICMAVAWHCESSISYYYYTRSGVFFTSILTLCGIFLISYRGEEKSEERLSTNIITWIAGGLIIIVAFVPTPFRGQCLGDCGPTPFFHYSNTLGAVHFVSAVLFFICMGYISIFRFRSEKRPEKLPKKIRYTIYLYSGLFMWAVLLFAGIMLLIRKENQNDHFVLWIEVALLVPFGLSWLVKGKALVDLRIQDEDNEP